MGRQAKNSRKENPPSFSGLVRMDPESGALRRGRTALEEGLRPRPIRERWPDAAARDPWSLAVLPRGIAIVTVATIAPCDSALGLLTPGQNA